MSDQTKLTIHFLVSKLIILAVPLLNQLLVAFGINVTTSNSTIDSLANMICIGLGLAYSWWSHNQAVKSLPPAHLVPTDPSTIQPAPSLKPVSDALGNVTISPSNSVPQPPPPKPLTDLQTK